MGNLKLHRVDLGLVLMALLPMLIGCSSDDEALTQWLIFNLHINNISSTVYLNVEDMPLSEYLTTLPQDMKDFKELFMDNVEAESRKSFYVPSTNPMRNFSASPCNHTCRFIDYLTHMVKGVGDPNVLVIYVGDATLYEPFASSILLSTKMRTTVRIMAVFTNFKSYLLKLIPGSMIYEEFNVLVVPIITNSDPISAACYRPLPTLSQQQGCKLMAKWNSGSMHLSKLCHYRQEEEYDKLKGKSTQLMFIEIPGLVKYIGKDDEGHIQIEGNFARNQIRLLEHDLNMKAVIKLLYPTERKRWLTGAVEDTTNADIWAAIIVSIGVTTMVMTILSSCSPRHDANKSHLKSTTSFWALYARLVLQGESVTNHQGRSVNALLQFWAFFVLLVTTVYSGMYLSFMTNPRYETKIDSFEDLERAMETKGYIWRTVERIGVKETMEDFYLSSKTKYIYGRLWDKCQCADSAIWNLEGVNTTEELFSKIWTDKLAVIVSKDIISEFLEKHSDKPIYTSPTQMSPKAYFAVRSGLPYKKRLTKFFQRQIEYGFLSFKKPIRPIPKSTTQKPATLVDFQGAFFLLGVGYSLAVIAFVFERILGKKAGRPKVARRTDRYERLPNVRIRASQFQLSRTFRFK